MGLVRGENVLVLLAKAPLSLGAQARTPALRLFVSGILLLLLPSVAFPFLLAPSHQHLNRLTSLTPQKPFYLVECPTFKRRKQISVTLLHTHTDTHTLEPCSFFNAFSQ